MENASKALIMAGAVLITLLVIGAFMLMLNQVSDYQKTGEISKEQQQLADYNSRFLGYERNNVQGNELISLMNQFIDQNNRKTGAGMIDYEKEITLKISIGQQFAKKNGQNPVYILPGEYVINKQTDDLAKQLLAMRDLETNYTVDIVKQLKEIQGLTVGNSKDKTKERVGKEINLTNTEITLLSHYDEYYTFKSGIFKSSGKTEYWQNGQIKSMSFTFDR